ncbi:MAG TPA: glutamate--cysteine ligase, partial [Chromatiaceae bacterium]|nr:glutamate--cysteine ligase [Chromatiaceae bacterium]
MGQEIETPDFTPADLVEFRHRLDQETQLLASWLSTGALPAGPKVGGFELEAWLVGPDLRPLPRAPDLLARLADPLVVPELATFNLEFNGTPQVLAGSALSAMAAELIRTWDQAQTVA